MNPLNVALAPFLRSYPAVITLGLRACLSDYSQSEKQLLREAKRVFFPTPRFCDIFQALEKPTFPNPTTYRYQRSRILQQLLVQYLKLPQPRSRICFGWKQKQAVLRDFSFPLLVIGSDMPCAVPPQSLFPVEDNASLQGALARLNPVIVRQAVDFDERVQFICVNYECIGALRATGNETGHLFPEPVPFEHHNLRFPLLSTLDLVRTAHLDDVLIEWGRSNAKWLFIQLTRPPVSWNSAGGRSNRFEHIASLIETGIL